MRPNYYGVSSSGFVEPRDKYYPLDISYERGGIAISDISKGLQYQNWLAFVDGSDIVVRTATSTQELYRITCYGKPEEIDLTFDQNMRPVIAYQVGNNAYVYSFHIELGDYSHTKFEGVRNPRVALDEKRLIAINESDVIFGFMQGNKLCYKIQRDRWLVTTELKDYSLTHTNKRYLWKIGMTKDNRFGFYVR